VYPGDRVDRQSGLDFGVYKRISHLSFFNREMESMKVMRVSLLIFLLGLFLNFGAYANSSVLTDYRAIPSLTRHLPITIEEAAELGPMQLQTFRCLAWNLYFEARGQARDEQIAIAWVPINRTEHSAFSTNICENIFQYRQSGRQRFYQFSWVRYILPTNWRREDATWIRVQRIALQVYRGEVTDPSHGAVYFHNHNIERSWSSRSRKIRIGAHVFWRM
jgi:N-acetylmuramoyl-L-alanine amidase